MTPNVAPLSLIYVWHLCIMKFYRTCVSLIIQLIWIYLSNQKNIITWWKSCKCKEPTEGYGTGHCCFYAENYLKETQEIPHKKGSDYFAFSSIFPIYCTNHSFLIASVNITISPWNIHILKLCHKMLSQPSHLMEYSTTVMVVVPSHCDANNTP